MTLRSDEWTETGESSGVSPEIAALVPRYLASKLRQIEEARTSLAAKDFEPVRIFGHNLKGTGLGYGFPRIEEIGDEMEQAALDQDELNISRQLDALCRFLTEECACSHTLKSSPK